MVMQSAIRGVSAGADLDRIQMTDVMRVIMQGDATPAQHHDAVAAFRCACQETVFI